MIYIIVSHFAHHNRLISNNVKNIKNRIGVIWCAPPTQGATPVTAVKLTQNCALLRGIA